MLKPRSCQPPSEHPYVLQQTDDDQSILSLNTDGYSTAHSNPEDNDVSEMDEFMLAEKLFNELPENMDLPQQTCDELIFSDGQGKFKRFRSALSWIKNISSDNHLDCAAQISSKDVLVEQTSEDTTSTPPSVTDLNGDATDLAEESMVENKWDSSDRLTVDDDSSVDTADPADQPSSHMDQGDVQNINNMSERVSP